MPEQAIQVVNASLSSKESAATMANEITSRISAANKEGWECTGISNVQTTIAGNPGCFGIGATSSYHHSVCVLLFRRNQ